MLVGDVVSDATRAAALEEEWDALATAARRPFCAPAWMLAWWTHVRPAGALMRIVTVREDGRLIGIAPFYVDPGQRGPIRYRTLASGTSLRTEPLAVPGREKEVAAIVARTLRETTPAPDVISFEGCDSNSPWPEVLTTSWDSGRPAWNNCDWTIPAPVLRLNDRTYEEWFSQRSGNFRQQMRRTRRQMDDRGATFRLAQTPGELARDLEAFSQLHHARWDPKGGSEVLTPEVERMLAEAGPKMLAGNKFRLWSVDVDGHTISSHLFLAAGGEVAYWLGGFDDSWKSWRPSLQTILVAIEHAWEHGDQRMDLGGGAQDYKYRFADSDDTLQWLSVVPRGRRYLLTRVRLAPLPLRRRVMGRLGPGSRARLRRLFRR
jgi:CelD/BcsL family acetyltransferase involved in cellulose biosynthesis